jgi:hypothetical protein
MEDVVQVTRKYKRQPAVKFGSILLLLGTVSLVLSVIFTLSILTWLGLGLTFWGILFLLIRPVAYVKSNLLDSTILPSLVTLDRMLTELDFQGSALYLPPRSLKGSQEGVLFIAAKKETVIPTISDSSQRQIFMAPHGICLVPPGQGLVNLFEDRLGRDFFAADFDYLQRNLHGLLVEDLDLAQDFDIDIAEDIVHVLIKGSVYSKICDGAKKLNNICSRVGCPLCSAIAYSLAKATGKAVVIERNELHENETIETWYKLIDVT